MTIRHSRLGGWGAVHLIAAVVLAADAAPDAARLRPETIRGWETYAAAVETRRAHERDAPRGFLAMDFHPDGLAERQALRRGEMVVREVDAGRSGAPDIDVPGGRVHHWRGAVLIAGASVPDLLTRIEYASPPAIQEDVLSSSVLSREPGAVTVFLKVRRKKIVTAVFNTEHRVRFEQLGPARGASVSTATKIAELQHPGTAREHELPPGQDRGFLWRLNAYWRYEAVPGGVIAECESISLSRDVPALLEYIAGRLIAGAARESMEATLEALRARYAAD